MQEQQIDTMESAQAPAQAGNDMQNAIMAVIDDKNLSSEQKAAQIAGMFKAGQSSGPIPPPSVLEGYNAIIANAPERFMKMVEDAHKASVDEQAANTQIMKDLTNAQRMKVRNDNKANMLSQIFAFILIILFIGAGVYLTVTSHDTVGGIIFGTTIVGVSSMFITGTINKQGQAQQDGME